MILPVIVDYAIWIFDVVPGSGEVELGSVLLVIAIGCRQCQHLLLTSIISRRIHDSCAEESRVVDARCDANAYRERDGITRITPGQFLIWMCTVACRGFAAGSTPISHHRSRFPMRQYEISQLAALDFGL